MNWKQNSRTRLGDIEEENGIEGTDGIRERGASREEQEAEIHHRSEDFQLESKKHADDEEREENREVPIDSSVPDGPIERRRTIYELDSYAASNISMFGDFEGVETNLSESGESGELRYSESLVSFDNLERVVEQYDDTITMMKGMPGIARINLSPLTQKIIGCVIGENVTTEYPWIYVRKEIIEDNLDLHAESSDFLPIKDQINAFPEKKMLVGYAPSSIEDGQFYICLTEDGKDAVVKNIETLRLEQENRVKNAVYKTPGKWSEFGSGREVDDTVVKKTRPLFEIEVESTSDLLNAPIKLIDRNANDQRDGYVELLSYRQTFDNVTTSLVSRGEQANLPIRDNNAQTRPSMLVNSWFQYRYEYKPINTAAYNEDETESMERFLDKHTDVICDKVLQNATWDIYTNDYANLVRNERDTQPPVPIAYTEHQSYYDGKITKDKLINDLCWHPLWTGIAVAAYTDHCKSDCLVGPSARDEVLKACEGENQVLVWSFDDCLTPKLILKCPREVTAISICPLDGNVIVGGCANGQIAVWSIPGKIQQVETVTVDTTARVKYRTAIKSLMAWMRESTSSSVIEPVAMSSILHSQKASITEIIWLPSYNKVDKNGRIENLPGDTNVDDLGWQFSTASEDGTVAFWDLRWRPPEDKEKKGWRDKTRKKKNRTKKTVQRPDALVRSISPLKALDGIFRPEYMLQVNYPGDERRVVITTMSIYRPKFRKEEIEPFPLTKNDISVRKYYKLVIEKPDYDLEPVIFIGTVEGDVARISWEGYDFTTGVAVNRESAKWLWRNGIHDGPVTHSVRSKYLKDVFVTVGGNIFAVWREDFGEPVFSRNSTVRYTACCWGTFRPTVLLLARDDGTVEIWDFIVKSHEPSFTQSLSGRIITGIYTHELYLDPQCVAFCDFNGTLRVFTAPPILLSFDASDVGWMRKFVDREVKRIREFKNWQKMWNETNLENIERRKKEAELEAEKKRLEAEEKIKEQMAEIMKKERLAKAAKTTRKPGEFLEETKNRWKAMELKRMQRVILEKKGLREDVLQKQRAPIMKLRQDARRKKKKIREIMEVKDKIFEDTVSFLFPEQNHYDRKVDTDPPILSECQDDENEDEDEEDAGVKAAVLAEQPPTTKFESPEEEIMHNFVEIEREALATMKKNPYQPTFEWRKILSEGKARRRSMDVELKRSNRRKGRILWQKVPETRESTTKRNSPSGYEAWEASPTDRSETGP